MPAMPAPSRPAARAALLAACLGAPAPLSAQHDGHPPPPDSGAAVWRMPPRERPMPMMIPQLMGATPPVTPFLPGLSLDPASLPAARFREIQQAYETLREPR